MTIDETIAELRAVLTEAQIKALMRHNPSYGSDNQGWPEPARQADSFCQAGRALMDLGLINWADKLSSRTVITDKGERAREALARGR